MAGHRPESAKVEILNEAVAAFQRRDLAYRDILERLPAAIYTTDAQGRITYYNHACIAFSGRVPAAAALDFTPWLP